MVSTSQSSCHWGKVSWVVNSVRLLAGPALHWWEQTRPSLGWQPFSKWGQEYFEVVTALTGDLTPRDATKLFNFLTFPDIEKESGWWVTNINGVLNPDCCGSCLSFSYSGRKKGIIRQAQGGETVCCHSVTIFIISPQPLLHGDVVCFLYLCASVGSDRNNYLASSLVEQAGFLWWEHLQSSNTGDLFNLQRTKAYFSLHHLLLFWFLHVVLSAFHVITKRKSQRRRKERKRDILNLG